MSPSSRIRNIQKKITALEAKYKDYEDRFEALGASTASGGRSRSSRDQAIGLKEKMNIVKNEITGCEHEIMRIREGVARSVWS